MLDKRLFGEVRKIGNYMRALVANGIGSYATTLLQAFCIAALVTGVFQEDRKLGELVYWIIGFFLVICLKAALTFLFERKFRSTALHIKNNLVKRYIEDMAAGSPLADSLKSTGARTVTVCETADYVEPYYFDYIPQFFSVALSVPLILFSVLFLDWVSFLIMLVTAPLLPLFLSLIGRASAAMNKKRIRSLKHLGGSFLDILNGMKTIKLFEQVQRYRQKVFHSSEGFRRMTMDVLKVSFLSAFVLELAATISTAIIAVSLGLRLMNGSMQFFSAFFILLLAPDYYMSIRKFGTKFHVGMSAKAAADSLYADREVSVRKVAVPSETEQEAMTSQPVRVEFRKAGYLYKNTSVQALQELDLVIPAGKMTAVVGRSGAGKSTLANALMGFIEMDSGDILINGVPIDKYETGRLRRLIAYIPQKPLMFSGSLWENICLARPEAKPESVREAVKLAALEEFIDRKPEGLDFCLKEAGSGVSVGEAQRIAVARALLKESPLVIIDEATSALDKKNEQLLKQSFDALRTGRTLLVIAHRLETVRNADLIHVVEQGRVAESGTHEQLMAAGGAYRQLVDAWGWQG